eukprot:m.113173 g.113173  ORF g.113173 m.113173 type:complete len:888 (+) comp9262_c0_seq2:812-3475(+)
MNPSDYDTVHAHPLDVTGVKNLPSCEIPTITDECENESVLMACNETQPDEPEGFDPNGHQDVPTSTANLERVLGGSSRTSMDPLDTLRAHELAQFILDQLTEGLHLFVLYTMVHSSEWRRLGGPGNAISFMLSDAVVCDTNGRVVKEMQGRKQNIDIDCSTHVTLATSMQKYYTNFSSLDIKSLLNHIFTLNNRGTQSRYYHNGVADVAEKLRQIYRYFLHGNAHTQPHTADSVVEGDSYNKIYSEKKLVAVRFMREVASLIDHLNTQKTPTWTRSVSVDMASWDNTTGDVTRLLLKRASGVLQKVKVLCKTYSAEFSRSLSLQDGHAHRFNSTTPLPREKVTFETVLGRITEASQAAIFSTLYLGAYKMDTATRSGALINENMRRFYEYMSRWSGIPLRPVPLFPEQDPVDANIGITRTTSMESIDAIEEDDKAFFDEEGVEKKHPEFGDVMVFEEVPGRKRCLYSIFCYEQEVNRSNLQDECGYLDTQLHDRRTPHYHPSHQLGEQQRQRSPSFSPTRYGNCTSSTSTSSSRRNTPPNILVDWSQQHQQQHQQQQSMSNPTSFCLFLLHSGYFADVRFVARLLKEFKPNGVALFDVEQLMTMRDRTAHQLHLHNTTHTVTPRLLEDYADAQINLVTTLASYLGIFNEMRRSTEWWALRELRHVYLQNFVDTTVTTVTPLSQFLASTYTCVHDINNEITQLLPQRGSEKVSHSSNNTNNNNSNHARYEKNEDVDDDENAGDLTSEIGCSTSKKRPMIGSGRKMRKRISLSELSPHDVSFQIAQPSIKSGRQKKDAMQTTMYSYHNNPLGHQMGVKVTSIHYRQMPTHQQYQQYQQLQHHHQHPSYPPHFSQQHEMPAIQHQHHLQYRPQRQTFHHYNHQQQQPHNW